MKQNSYDGQERTARHAAGTAYTLIRSERKTLAVEIGQDARVLVRAPRRLPLWRIEAFLEQKQAWIAEKLAQARRSAQAREAAIAVRPRRLPLFGEEYPVCYTQVETLEFAEGRFTLPDRPFSELGPLLEAFYRKQAAEVLPVGLLLGQKQLALFLAAGAGPAGGCGLRGGARAGACPGAQPFAAFLAPCGTIPAGLPPGRGAAENAGAPPAGRVGAVKPCICLQPRF